MAQYAFPTTRYINGISTARVNTLFGNYVKPNPVASYYYENDFATYAAGDWTVAPATGTTALASGVGGTITLTTGAVSGNGQGNALNPTSFQFVGGNAFGGQVWFSCGFTDTAALTSNWLIGLTAGGAGAPTSGIYFSRATAVAPIVVTLNKAAATTVLTTIASSAVGLQQALGFYWDGKPTPSLYIFSSTPLTTNTQFGQPYWQGGTMIASFSADGLNPNPVTNIPTVPLQPSVFVQTNAAATQTLTVDYLTAAQEIPLRF